MLEAPGEDGGAEDGDTGKRFLLSRLLRSCLSIGDTMKTMSLL